MGTECQKQLTEEVEQWLKEAEERVQQDRDNIVGCEEYQREMPAIQASLETRTIELLQENIRNSQERLNEARTFSSEVSREGKEEWERKLGEIDHSRWPSDKESRETCRAGRELKINEWSCASLPPVTGLGVKDMQPHIKGTIAVLSQNEKLWQYRQLWSEPFANKILFADRDALRKEGIDVPEDVMAMTLRAQVLLKDKKLPSTIFVFSDPLTGEFPKGNALLHQLAHEIAHNNEHFKEGELKDEGKDMGWFKPVAVAQEDDSKIWERAVEAQLRKGFFSESSQMSLSDEEREAVELDPSLAADLVADPEKGNRHFVHELFAAWTMDSPDLCDEMRQFFDEYMPKAFGE